MDRVRLGDAGRPPPGGAARDLLEAEALVRFAIAAGLRRMAVADFRHDDVAARSRGVAEAPARSGRSGSRGRAPSGKVASRAEEGELVHRRASSRRRLPGRRGSPGSSASPRRSGSPRMRTVARLERLEDFGDDVAHAFGLEGAELADRRAGSQWPASGSWPGGRSGASSGRVRSRARRASPPPPRCRGGPRRPRPGSRPRASAPIRSPRARCPPSTAPGSAAPWTRFIRLTSGRSPKTVARIGPKRGMPDFRLLDGVAWARCATGPPESGARLRRSQIRRTSVPPKASTLPCPQFPLYGRKILTFRNL